MTLEEVSFWSAYRNKRGSLNIGRRVEQSIGNMTAYYAASKGAKNVKAVDFMPNEDQPKPIEMDLEDYMMMQFGDGNKAP